MRLPKHWVTSQDSFGGDTLVRQEGRVSDMELAFEPAGNALCLDFTNTVNARPTAKRDLLETPEGLSAWLEALELGHEQMPSAAPSILVELRDFREVVYALLRAVVGGKPMPPGPLASVVSRYAAALSSATWRTIDDRVIPGWNLVHPSQIPDLVAASAVQLLQDGPLSRLGQCPSCGWLFLDTSRNGRRRWCSMATCGSRDKSSRYFDRTKRGATEPLLHA